MSLFLDIGQGAGLAGSVGVRPYLPPLLVGALASADAGIDFDGTDYSFLEGTPFLAAVLAVAALSYLVERRRAAPAPGVEPGTHQAPTPREPWWDRLADATLLMLALVLGALFFAGSLAAGDEMSWWGLPAGALVAGLAYVAVAGLFARARRRLERSQVSLLTLYADALSLAAAALAILVDPIGYALLAVLVFLAVRSRGQGERKYAGLRVLR